MRSSSQVVTSGSRVAVAMGLCALVDCACGVSDRPLNAAGTTDTGGASSNGGATSSGGASSSGGAPSGGGIQTTGGRSSGGIWGGLTSGGTGAGGVLVGTGGTGLGGPDTTPSVTGPATTTSDGTLTNLAGASFVKTGGNLVITSLYATIEVLSTFNSIEIWGDVENRGTSLECIPLVDLSINGYAISTVAAGPAYKTSSSLSTVCVPPGGAGVISGIDNNVSSTLLDSASTVTYAFRTSLISSAAPHAGAPTISGVTIGNSTGLYAISGTMHAGSVDIWNLSLDFFIRDSSGLLRDRQPAFPADLGTIVAGSTMAFSTSGRLDPFARYVEFPDFIEGVAANVVQGPEADFAARKRVVDQLFANVAAARRRISRP